MKLNDEQWAIIIFIVAGTATVSWVLFLTRLIFY